MIEDNLINIRGKKLYVKRYGSEQLPPILYLHGGPGTGSYDFEIHQASRLSTFAHVIALDQRGVLRSEEIHQDEEFLFDDLIEDCEELRKHLHIESWHLLSHSFGGLIALQYANSYPSTVKSLIFENPTFDLKLSSLSLLNELLDLHLANGNVEQASKCSDVLSKKMTTRELWVEFGNILGDASLLRNHLYVHGEDKDFFEELVAHASFPQEWWGKSGTFQMKLFDKDKVFESMLPLLQTIEVPSLLLHGKYDYVLDEEQIKLYITQVEKGKLISFEESSHFIRFEQPEEYAKAIQQFITFHGLIT
jgi:proline iminopeptidase